MSSEPTEQQYQEDEDLEEFESTTAQEQIRILAQLPSTNLGFECTFCEMKYVDVTGLWNHFKRFHGAELIRGIDRYRKELSDYTYDSQ